MALLTMMMERMPGIFNNFFIEKECKFISLFEFYANLKICLPNLIKQLFSSIQWEWDFKKIAIIEQPEKFIMELIEK
jgi:hypothetical protein